jgi:putative Mg2+ transporter-C (MgtC) family protein
VTPDLTLETQLDLALRLTVGLVLGAVIGFEREFQRQPAGFRTHSLVSLGAALFTVISAYGFSGDLVDPTRIAAQIVSGIGFIGAGTILQHRGHIRGLTTAASLWSVAAIGTAAGAGLYVVAIVGTLLILVVLSILDRIEAFARRRLRMPPDTGKPPAPEEVEDGRSEDLL